MAQAQTQNEKISSLLEFLSEHKLSSQPTLDFKVSPSGRIFSLQGRFAAEGLPKFLEIEKELTSISIRVEGREELFYSFNGRGKPVQEDDVESKESPPQHSAAKLFPSERVPIEENMGWVKLHRKIAKSAVFQNEGLLKVWIWCLIKANHEDAWVPVKTGRGTTQVLVKRGQFIFGRKTAAKALRMKEPTVQKRMMVLKNLQNLITQSISHYSLITIYNYNLYQSPTEDEISDKVSGKYQASITNKNDKNEKNKTLSGKKTPDPGVKEFIGFWYEAFKEKFGSPYKVTGGKEGNLVKSLLQTYSLDRLKELAKVFFQSNDPLIQKSPTIGVFSLKINDLIVEEGRKKKSW